MKYLVLVSHGEFAAGLKTSLMMLAGQRDDVIASGLPDGKTADEFSEIFKESVKDIHEDDEIEIRWNETPGKKMILAGLSSFTEELSGNFLYNSLLGDHNITTTELLHRLMEQTIEPAVRGYLKSSKETDSIDTDE